MHISFGESKETGEPVINVGEWVWTNHAKVSLTDEELAAFAKNISEYLASKSAT